MDPSPLNLLRTEWFYDSWSATPTAVLAPCSEFGHTRQWPSEAHPTLQPQRLRNRTHVGTPRLTAPASRDPEPTEERPWNPREVDSAVARVSGSSAPASPPALGRQIREEGRPPLGPRTKVSQAQKRSIRLPPRCARVERERESLGWGLRGAARLGLIRRGEGAFAARDPRWRNPAR